MAEIVNQFKQPKGAKLFKRYDTGILQEKKRFANNVA